MCNYVMILKLINCIYKFHHKLFFKINIASYTKLIGCYSNVFVAHWIVIISSLHQNKIICNDVYFSRSCVAICMHVMKPYTLPVIVAKVKLIMKVVKMLRTLASFSSILEIMAKYFIVQVS